MPARSRRALKTRIGGIQLRLAMRHYLAHAYLLSRTALPIMLDKLKDGATPVARRVLAVFFSFQVSAEPNFEILKDGQQLVSHHKSAISGWSPCFYARKVVRQQRQSVLCHCAAADCARIFWQWDNRLGPDMETGRFVWSKRNWRVPKLF